MTKNKMIYKTFRVEVKDVDEENGIVNMLIPMSTGSVDRDGEVIEPSAWRKSLPVFRKRPILLSSHDYKDLRKQIGEFVKLKLTDDGLFARPKYYINEGNEEADWAFKLAAKNMAAYSVGFIPKVWEDGDGEKTPRRTYKENELLEISHIVVPSNRDAIQGLMAKGIQDPIVGKVADEVLDAVEDGVITTKEFEVITKPEETDDWIRIPVKECNVTATIDISKKEGIKALYCGKEKQVRTYMFDKRDPYNWTMAKAKKWVEDHKAVDEIPEGIEIEEKAITQAGVKDEIDYLKGIIEDVGLNEEAMEYAWELMREIMGLAGNHIPVDIAEKLGAVLNAKNRDRLNQIKALAQSILDSADKPEEPSDDKKEAKVLPMQEIAKMVAGAVKDEIDRLRGKVG